MGYREGRKRRRKRRRAGRREREADAAHAAGVPTDRGDGAGIGSADASPGLPPESRATGPEQVTSTASPQPIRLVLHFDGSCLNNPGGRASYGWVLDAVDAAGGLVRVAHAHGPVYAAPGKKTTNNLAEWAALRRGLEWLGAWDQPWDVIEVVGDSQLVVYQLTGDMACNQPHLREHRDVCRKLLRGTGRAWVARWTPRANNREADRLAGG